jgi:hypothetical protein
MNDYSYFETQHNPEMLSYIFVYTILTNLYLVGLLNKLL